MSVESTRGRTWRVTLLVLPADILEPSAFQTLAGCTVSGCLSVQGYS
jgi:hypothetical protein